jgi:hypothetical protein
MGLVSFCEWIAPRWVIGLALVALAIGVTP